MAKYLLIESRDPFDSADSEYFCRLSEGLSNGGNEIVLFLIQNGVLPARKGSKYNSTLARLIQQKVRILVDGFSVKERAIRNLMDGVEISDVSHLVDLVMTPSTKTMWH